MLNTQSVPVEKIQCEMPPAKKLVRRMWKRCVGERKHYWTGKKRRGGGASDTFIGLVSGGTEYPQCYREMPYSSKPTPSRQFCPWIWAVLALEPAPVLGGCSWKSWPIGVKCWSDLLVVLPSWDGETQTELRGRVGMVNRQAGSTAAFFSLFGCTQS